MEQRPPLYFGVVAVEKGACGSPSTKVANFTFYFIFAHTYIQPDTVSLKETETEADTQTDRKRERGV